MAKKAPIKKRDSHMVKFLGTFQGKGGGAYYYPPPCRDPFSGGDMLRDSLNLFLGFVITAQVNNLLLPLTIITRLPPRAPTPTTPC